MSFVPFVVGLGVGGISVAYTRYEMDERRDRLVAQLCEGRPAARMTEKRLRDVHGKLGLYAPVAEREARDYTGAREWWNRGLHSARDWVGGLFK